MDRLFRTRWRFLARTTYSGVCPVDSKSPAISSIGPDILARASTGMFDSRSAYLGTVTQIMVASPGYVLHRGVPGCLEELAEHNCVTYGGQMTGGHWDLVGPAGSVLVRPHARVSADSMGAVRDAVFEGCGIALVTKPSIRDEIASGALVHVLADYSTPPPPVPLYYPSRRHLSPRTRAVIDCIVKVAQELG